MTIKANNTRGQRTERPNVEESRAERIRERTPVSGRRDKLTVHGKNPDYFYYWVKDSNEEGQEIFKFTRAGYEFVRFGEVSVGQNAVYKTANVGSIIRQPAGHGEWLYLMRLPMDLYLQDHAEAQADITRREREMTRQRAPEEIRDDEQYNTSKITRDLR